jgi:hypothetical protein
MYSTDLTSLYLSFLPIKAEELAAQKKKEEEQRQKQKDLRKRIKSMLQECGECK